VIAAGALYQAMSSPRVSVGLPVYNGQRFLAAAVDSLLCQTFTDFELILADNASTDGTASLCRSYAAADTRVKYVRNESNIGVYRNCNQVIRLARGEYFKLAAADDLCHPELLARCVQLLDSDQTVVATYSRTGFIDEAGESLSLSDPGWHLVSDAAHERLRYVIRSGHWVNLFFGLTRARELAKTRLFPLYAGGDCRLLGELCLRGKFVEIPEVLFSRRIHSAASSQNASLDWQSYFFTGRRGRPELPLLHVCLDHCRTIVESDMNARHKLSSLVVVADRMVASRRTLLQEMGRALDVVVFGGVLGVR